MLIITYICDNNNPVPDVIGVSDNWKFYGFEVRFHLENNHVSDNVLPLIEPMMVHKLEVGGGYALGYPHNYLK